MSSGTITDPTAEVVTETKGIVYLMPLVQHVSRNKPCWAGWWGLQAPGSLLVLLLGLHQCLGCVLSAGPWKGDCCPGAAALESELVQDTWLQKSSRPSPGGPGPSPRSVSAFSTGYPSLYR